jgi:cytochrome c biogenesis protein CcmG/thiol:disulfide interchange protein DsbE
MTTGPPTDRRMTAGSAVRTGPDLRRLPLPYLVVAAGLPLILVLVLGALLLARSPSPPTAIGSVAPDFTLATLDGEPISLAELRGRPVIVNFWASWCGPCIEEFPLLRDAAARHEPDGLAVIGIVYRDRSAAAREFMGRHGGTWAAAMDPGERVANAYGVVGPPETYFIARDGTIAGRHIGQFTSSSLDQQLAAIIQPEE